MPAFALTVATCVTVTALAVAIIVVHALKFAKWAIEREDRFALTHQPLTTAVRKLKVDTLVKQRQQHEDRWGYLLKSGFDRQAAGQQEAIVRIDEEILAAERAPLEEGPGG